MMHRFSVAVTLLQSLPAAAHAERHVREAAIMGTRISAEVWHDGLSRLAASSRS